MTERNVTMKRLLLWLFACGLVFFSPPISAQWIELYATWDDFNTNINAIGHNTPSAGVIHEDTFVALVTTRNTRCYMIPYVNADSADGRLYTYGYGSTATSGIYQEWNFGGGFDQVFMKNAWQNTAMPDSLVYVANNDDAEHNILVFKLENDTIAASPYRNITGSNIIWGIEVDQNGYVYVTNDTSNGVTNDVKVYPPVTQWSPFHDTSPVQTIDLPDGVYRGVTVSPDGKWLFVSDYGNRRVLKFVGSPTTGYVQDVNFNFQLAATDTIVGTTIRPGPLGLAYLSPNGLLFIAVDAFRGGGAAYSYGRIYVVNSITGELAGDSTVSVIDVAKWNFDHTGAYNDRGDGTQPGNASGYTSTYDVEFDDQGNLYSQSYYGWTVEKWQYQGTLPTITSVEEVSNEMPSQYFLSQNYPNPFNPSTAIEFSLTRAHHVTLRIYDVLGREVAALADGDYPPGKYRVMFDATHLASGVYLYTLTAGEYISTKKMTLVK